MFISDDLFAQEMKPTNWTEIIETSYQNTFTMASATLDTFYNHPDFYKFLVGVIVSLAVLIPTWTCWNEWAQLKRDKVKLENALADTEDELEYERQILAEQELFFEWVERRIDTFQKIKNHVGTDKKAWNILVTNEVLTLRRELNQIRNGDIC